VEPLRIGLVGLGTMGRGHLEKEQALDEARIVAVADVVPSAVQAAREKYGVRGFDSYEALIESGEVEAVLIATPHPFHAPIAIHAAERGLHVLSEKPIAVTVAEADRMVDAARRANVRLGVMFQTRTDPVFRAARRILEAGEIGQVYRTTLVATAWYRTQAYYDSGAWRGTWTGEGGGVVMNQAPHSLDAFVWLGGQPSRVQARAWTRGHRIEVEDTVTAMLEYPNGATGYLYTTTAEWPGENRFELVGDRGKLQLVDGQLRVYRMDKPLREEIDTGEHWGKPTGRWEDVAVQPGQTGHAEVVRRFARAVRLEEPMVATGEDGVRQLELANALLVSGYMGEAVSLPLDRAKYDAWLDGVRVAVGASH
jgi:predicted dehydrogenase